MNRMISAHRRMWILLLLGCQFFAMPARADQRTAAAKVREGIQHFGAGGHEAAGQAFAAAYELVPDDPRVAFDRACAFAGKGETDQAVEWFKKAALARDTN